MIALVDYGSSNIRSVEKGFETLGYTIKVTDDPKDVVNADAVVLPGVGAFADCLNALNEKGLEYAVKKSIISGKPYLGICLGMQILFEKSYELGIHKGFSILKGEVKKLPEDVKVPHMGWNRVKFKNNSPLFKGLGDEIYAYFVHSFYADAESIDEAALTDYGIKFCSAAYQRNIFGVQFHPEKSGEKGLQILKNFAEMVK